MINLGTICVIGEAKLETSWVEVLVHTSSIEPVGTDATREVKVKVLHTEVVRLVIELALELYLTKFAERRYSVSNVTCGNSRLGRRHQVGTFQRGIAAPVG